MPPAIYPPELKVRTPVHTKQLGWYVEFESRVTQNQKIAAIGSTAIVPGEHNGGWEN